MGLEVEKEKPVRCRLSGLNRDMSVCCIFTKTHAGTFAVLANKRTLVLLPVHGPKMHISKPFVSFL